MWRPNHASRFEGIAKTNLQASRASDTEILQSQVNKAAKKRLSLNGLEILHGRLINDATAQSEEDRSPSSRVGIGSRSTGRPFASAFTTARRRVLPRLSALLRVGRPG